MGHLFVASSLGQQPIFQLMWRGSTYRSYLLRWSLLSALTRLVLHHCGQTQDCGFVACHQLGYPTVFFDCSYYIV